MRRQGIHLGNAGRIGDKGGTDRAAGAHEIALFVRVLHEFVGDDVHDGKPVLNDGIQLFVKSLLHKSRQRIPVLRMRHAVAELRQFFIRMLNDGRALVGPHRGDALHHACDFLRVFDDDFLALFRAEIGKLSQHFLRRSKIERRLPIGIVIFVAEKNHATVYLIFGV